MPETDPFNARINPEEYAFVVHTNNHGVSPLPLGPERTTETTATIGNVVRGEINQVLTVILPDVIADEMPRAHAELVVEHDSNRGETYYAAGDARPSYMEMLRKRHASYMGDFALHALPEAHDVAPTVSTDDAIEIIQAHDPRDILFLGGSGMSAEQIWTHQMLGEQVGYAIGPAEVAHAQNNVFVREFIAEPHVAARGIALFNEFTRQKTIAQPTAAHHAFSDIMGRLNDRPMAITTNFDKLYEQTGLRVPQIGFTWPETATSSWDDDHIIAPELERRARSLSLIVAIGIGGDYKNILRYIRQENPDVTTLAINIANPAELDYMHASDALLQRDAQRAVPAIAQALAT